MLLVFPTLTAPAPGTAARGLPTTPTSAFVSRRPEPARPRPVLTGTGACARPGPRARPVLSRACATGAHPGPTAT
ncbi:hypothetical protein, partial [Actinokineospora sp. PR83]|uniref:hypothetical protein n=1 Tax=Actinokineospora sp. PR83 TaxID=2884908 RepID=UPI002714CF33